MTEESDETNKKKSEKINSIIIVILIFIGLGYFYIQSRKTKMTNINTGQSSIIPNDENFLAGTDLVLAPVRTKSTRTRRNSTLGRAGRKKSSLSMTSSLPPGDFPLPPGYYISGSQYWPNWS